MNAKKREAVNHGYVQVFEKIKNDIRQSQLKAALSVTRELIMLYWRIGRVLSDKVSQEGWGAKTIEKLAKDLASTFPGISGFSYRNLKYMRQFAESYPDHNWATAVAQIPWGHNIAIMEKAVNLLEKMVLTTMWIL